MGYLVEFHDMLDEKGVKMALYYTHKMLATNIFSTLSEIEKVIIFTPTEVGIVLNDHIKYFEYDSRYKRLEYVNSKEL